MYFAVNTASAFELQQEFKCVTPTQDSMRAVNMLSCENTAAKRQAFATVMYISASLIPHLKNWERGLVALLCILSH